MEEPQDDDEESQAPQVETLIEDPLPKCIKCGGDVTFYGHEIDENQWFKKILAWFKCNVCGHMWSVRLEKPLRLIFCTRR